MLISFDIFDTAIVRKTFLPTGIFEIIEDKVGNDFKNKRINAENLARDKYKVYNIDHIYEFLTGFDKNIEIDTEIENCIQNKEVFEIYNKHLNKGDEVIFISDMYLSGSILYKILENCGYVKPKIFVSCENNSHKGDSSLFKVVQNIMGKQIDKHYGDNYTADIIGAKNCGIIPEYLPRLDNLKNNVPEISTKLRKLLVLNEFSDKNLNQKVAYYWAPIIYNFTKWVLEERDKKLPNSKIFFNARDGYIPYLIARDIFKANNIEYIHTSRKSLIPPSINFDKKITDDENKFTLERILLQRANSMTAFLKLLYFPEEKWSLLKKLDTKDYPRQKFIILNEKVLYEHFKQQKETTVKYLKNIDIKDNDILVDIGYYGSLQYSMQRILNIKINGYYFQTKENLDKNIYLETKKHSYLNKGILKFCFLAESLFSSDEDGVLSYGNDGSPIFYTDNKHKKSFSKEIEHEILNACKYFYKENIKITYLDIEKLLTRFQYYPTLEESHYCTEEIFENGDIDNNESVVWYNRDKIKQGELQDCYNKSYWRPAFEKLLQNDVELSHLEKQLKKEY